VLFISVAYAAVGAAMHFHSAVTDMPANSGGLLGTQVSEILISIFNPLGATLFMLALLLVGINLLGMSWLKLIDTTGAIIVGGLKNLRERSAEKKIAKEAKQERKIVVEKEMAIVAKQDAPKIGNPAKKKIEKSVRAMKEKQFTLFRDHVSKSCLPPLSLLDMPTPSPYKVDEKDLQAMARLLELKLKEFNIRAQVTEVFPGPIITR